MDTETAIKEIKDMIELEWRHRFPADLAPDYIEALEMAIEALQKQEPDEMNSKQSKTPTMQLLEGARRYVLTHMVWYEDTTFTEPRLSDLGQLIINLIDAEIERQRKKNNSHFVTVLVRVGENGFSSVTGVYPSKEEAMKAIEIPEGMKPSGWCYERIIEVE